MREYYDTKSYLYPTANISHEAFMIKNERKGINKIWIKYFHRYVISRQSP